MGKVRTRSQVVQDCIQIANDYLREPYPEYTDWDTFLEKIAERYPEAVAMWKRKLDEAAAETESAQNVGGGC